MDESGKKIIGLLEMTSLRGLDGIHAKPEGHHHKGGSLNLRDDSVLDHYTKQISKGLQDIDERQIYMGQRSIFEFGFEMNQKEDPFKNVQAGYLNMTIPPRQEESAKQSGNQSPDQGGDTKRSASSSNEEEF